MKLKKMMLRSMAVLCVLCLATGCSKEQQEEKKEEKKVVSNCSIVECMKKIEATNTIEEINDIIGFEYNTYDMIIRDTMCNL